MENDYSDVRQVRESGQLGCEMPCSVTFAYRIWALLDLPKWVSSAS
jgi:hypothetical protein